ncbi:MAG: glycosyltransferase [Candidatus Methanoperedens sp.]
MEKVKKVSVILPTYNEKGNIVELINEIFKHLSTIEIEKEIVVVDDNSPDGTGNIVQLTFAKDKDVKICIRNKDRGLATAIRYGIENSTGDVIVVMDTDFNHDPKMLPQMVKFLEYHDVIGGSRFTMGGGMEPTYRYLGSYFFNLGIRIILNTQIQDNLSGFFSIRREKLLLLDFDKIFFGYGDYFFRLLYYAKKETFSMLEIPVVYQLRKSGESKTNLTKVLYKYMVALMKLRIKEI